MAHHGRAWARLGALGRTMGGRFRKGNAIKTYVDLRAHREVRHRNKTPELGVGRKFLARFKIWRARPKFLRPRHKILGRAQKFLDRAMGCAWARHGALGRTMGGRFRKGNAIDVFCFDVFLF